MRIIRSVNDVKDVPWKDGRNNFRSCNLNRARDESRDVGDGDNQKIKRRVHSS
jgi:hypothetical protein